MEPVQIALSSRLHLKTLDLSDTDALFALTDQNRAYLREWLPWLDHVTRPEGTQRFIESATHQSVHGTGLAFGIWLDGSLQGVLGYNQITPQNRCGFIGYWLAERVRGRGWMTAACRGLVEYGFERLELNRQVIACAVGNRRSRAIAERLGFVFEGIAFEAEWLYDDFVDHAIYAQTRRRWRSDRISDDPAPE